MFYTILHQYAHLMLTVCGIVFVVVLLLGLLFRSVVKSLIPDLPPVFVNVALVGIIVIQAAIVSGTIALVMLLVMFIAAVLH